MQYRDDDNVASYYDEGGDIEAHRHQNRDDTMPAEVPCCDTYNGEEVDIGVGVIYSPCQECGHAFEGHPKYDDDGKSHNAVTH